MKLVKCVIPHSLCNSYVYCKMGEIVEEKSSVLLGFKDCIPVITNSVANCEKNNEGPSKKILKLQVDPNTGEKFINLNGKKLKMVPESQIKSQLSLKKNLLMKSAKSFRILTKIPFNPNLVTPVKTDSQLNLCRTENIISQKSPITDKDKLIFGNNLIKEITTDNKGKCEYMDCVTVDRIKCIQRISTNNKLDMKVYNNEKKGHTLESGKFVSTKIGETLKDAAIQTESYNLSADLHKQSENISWNHFLSGLEFNNDFDESLFDLANPNLVTPNEQCTSDNYVATKFFGELRRAHLPNHEGNMPVHIGVITNNMSLVKRSCFILLNILGQDVDLRNNNDLTPLQLAITHNVDQNIIEYLLSKKANLEVTDWEGNNVIHLAVQYERTDILATLLEYTADNCSTLINQYNHEGMTPLLICSLNSLYECTELLLNREADINIRDQISGKTPLFHAAERKDLQMVELLLNYNADTKIKNFFGTSAHDAMYEIDEIPVKIKNIILGRTLKRKTTEDTRGMAKPKRPDDMKKMCLKTYARYEKINDMTIKKFKKV